MYNDIIQKLADMFFISAEYVQAHFWEYVLMYGKYHFWKEFPLVIVAAIFCTGLIMLGLPLVSDIEDDKKLAKFAVFTLCAIIAITALMVSLPYIMSPEMYSLEAVMELINGGT